MNIQLPFPQIGGKGPGIGGLRSGEKASFVVA